MRLKGLGVSPGVGVGRAVVLHRRSGDVGFGVSAGRVPQEVERLHAAREAAREQLHQITARITSGAGAGHVYLFDAQLLMLDDAMLVDRAAQVIADERLNAESALKRTLAEISARFDRGDDPYLRERKGDVADIVARLCGNLRAGEDGVDAFRHLEGPLVIVADVLSPSLVAQLDWHRIAALVSDEGSWTYHTAILARSIRIPAVAGLRN
ncbi:MAG: phosphoenolpyruvate--protein phosphotransferase, partial [Acidobacteria bacterium]|nr:phosphoenolpyruvate--protein phosphotransferase [Acidobacteriota bacterium]